MRLTFRQATALIFLLPGLAFGQQKDTARQKVNYRYQSSGDGEELSNIGKESYKYIGFQANQLLRQLLGSAGGGDNPFTATYAFNSVTTGSGFHFGIGFAKRKVEDEDPGSQVTRITKTSNLAFRAGYDYKRNIGKRWIAGVSADVFRDGGKSETISEFSGGGENVTESKSNTFGFGPRLSLMYNISERIYLGTETMLAFQSTKTKSKSDLAGGGFEDETTLKENQLKLNQPTALFLVVRF